MTVRVAHAIAIDGPGAAGKSTVGRLLASRLGYVFLDTGDMYRAVTWLALERGIDASDDAGLCRLIATAHITLEPLLANEDQTLIRIDGRDATPYLRSPQVDACVSLVSRVACVRQALVAQQRRLAQERAMVMAGRDIGTVVLPRARLKVYLDASVHERARRRLWQSHQGGGPSPEIAELAQVRAELERRDRIDQERAESPLHPAADAVVINTDGLSPEQTVERILELLQ